MRNAMVAARTRRFIPLFLKMHCWNLTLEGREPSMNIEQIPLLLFPLKSAYLNIVSSSNARRSPSYDHR